MIESCQTCDNVGLIGKKPTPAQQGGIVWRACPDCRKGRTFLLTGYPKAGKEGEPTSPPSAGRQPGREGMTHEKPANVADSTALVRKAVRMAKSIYPAIGRVPEEDLIQHGLLQLVKYGDKYDPARSAWSTFVFVCVKSGCEALAREIKRDKRILMMAVTMGSLGYGEENYEPPDPKARPVWIAAAAREQVGRLLSRLPADYRKLVADYHIGGLSMAEVAAKNGLSVQGVSKALELSMRRLQAEAMSEKR